MTIFVKGKPRVDLTLKAKRVLRRYLDISKFLDLIHNQTLIFSRGDQFEDKFEGAFTESIKKAINQAYSANNIAYSYEKFKTRLRERVFLNCWHASSSDSMAMWSMHGRSTSAVAITTTVDQLRKTIEQVSLPHPVSIVKVKYVRYWLDPKLKITPYSNVFAYKAKPYEFEKEVRIIIDRFNEEFANEGSETSMIVKIPLRKLLRSIVVSPEAPKWFHQLVKDVAAKYEIEAPAHRSKWSRKPV